eukprot:Clim_evm16s70 gene=Clim_evmTU16s70
MSQALGKSGSRVRFDEDNIEKVKGNDRGLTENEPAIDPERAAQWNAESAAFTLNQAKLKKHAELFELAIVRWLIDPVDDSELNNAAFYMTPSTLNDIIEERSLEKVCSWPTCTNSVAHSGSQTKAALEVRPKKVPDYLKQFCSKEHYENTMKFKERLDTDPIWTRGFDLSDPKGTIAELKTGGSELPPGPTADEGELRVEISGGAPVVERDLPELDAFQPPDPSQAEGAYAIENYAQQMAVASHLRYDADDSAYNTAAASSVGTDSGLGPVENANEELDTPQANVGGVADEHYADSEDDEMDLNRMLSQMKASFTTYQEADAALIAWMTDGARRYANGMDKPKPFSVPKYLKPDIEDDDGDGEIPQLEGLFQQRRDVVARSVQQRLEFILHKLDVPMHLCWPNVSSLIDTFDYTSPAASLSRKSWTVLSLALLDAVARRNQDIYSACFNEDTRQVRKGIIEDCSCTEEEFEFLSQSFNP